MRLLVVAAFFLAACNSSSAAAPAASAHVVGTSDAVAAADGKQRVRIRVTRDGFEPKEVKVPQGKPVVLEFTRETESECLNAVRMPWLTETVPLPLDKPVAIPFDAAKAGTVTYSCWMNMVFGKVTVTAS